MKNWFRNMGLLILLLLAGRMAAQVPVLDSICYGALRNYRVDGETGSTYSWILTPPSGPSEILPSDADTLQIAWTYAGGVYELQVIQHALNGCDAEAVFGQVLIFDQPLVYAGPDDMVCVGRYYKLTGANASGYSSLLWQTSGDGTFDDETYLNATYTPGANDIAAGVVTLTLTGFGMVEEGGCDPSVSHMELSVVYEIVPQFEPIGPLCQFSIPPALPDTSIEGMTGYWTPPTINTDFLGTFNYTFSPDDPAQCGIDTTIEITIVSEIIPQFEPIGPLCIYSTPPALPDTSLEGITGIWMPPAINTDVPGTFIYTFTPTDPSQCGSETSLAISILTEINPVFEPIGPLCQFSLPPELPDTSLNDIAGTWNPPVIVTDVTGTFSFTFTPYPDQCGLDTTVEIIIVPQVIPEFDPIGPLCQYSEAPALPDTSLEGITGIWIPAWINTAEPGTFTYTFIPDDPSQCGVVVTLDITILPEIVPEFDPIKPLCQFSAPPILPGTSLNGITGTWDPPVISTDITGTFFYTFTPDVAYECVLPLTIVVTIVSEIIPEFDPINPLCQFSEPLALPDTSLNDITGTWDPPVINTTITGISTYVFTPDEGQCADGFEMEIEVTEEITPVFDSIGPLCQYSVPPVLPGTSNNNITGAWNPSTINTDNPGTFTFVFTPDDGQCGVSVSKDITIELELTPEFDPIGPLCQYSVAPILAGTSNNNITGIWIPSTINTGDPGTFTFTFTPDDGQCGVSFVMNITIMEEVIPEFDPIASLCQYSPEPVLSGTSNNGVSGIWNPAVVNTSVPGVFTFIFTPDDPTQCAVEVSMDVTVTENPEVVLTNITDETDGLQNGVIEIIAAGSTPQLFYSIDNGTTWQTNDGLFENLAAGLYLCVVMDENNCDTSFTVEIENIIITQLQAITTPGSHCLGDAAIVPVEVDKFNAVAEFQMKLSYNVDKLRCEGYTGVHPLLADQISAWVNVALGEITIQWQSPVSVTFDQMETVLELVFTTKQEGQGELEWYTGPAESYFRDMSGLPIPAVFYANQLIIYQPPSIMLENSLMACEGDTVRIYSIASSSYPPLSYEWIYPDGSSHIEDPYFSGVTQSDAGDYTLIATDSLGCADIKTIRFIVSENPIAAFHGADTLTVPYGYILDAGYGLAYYLWNTGETTETITVDTTGLYWVMMESHVGCTGIDSVFVLTSEEIPMECLFIPNAFTPNNDGLNDEFKPVSVCSLSFYRMFIFNRWGEKLFESSDLSIGWDGKKNGSSLPGDAYVYKIAYKVEGSPEEVMELVKTGVVIIVKN